MKKNLGLGKNMIFTKKTFYKENSFIRFKLKDYFLSSSFFAIGRYEKGDELKKKDFKPPTIALKYHSDGSSSLLLKDMKIVNRIKDVVDEDDPKKIQKLKVYYPFENKLVINCWVCYERLRVYFFFEDEGMEGNDQHVEIEVQPEFFDQKYCFMFSLNHTQTIEILPNVKINWKFELPKRKKTYYTI